MRICPSCYGLYGPEQMVCPKDGTSTEDAVDVLIGKSLGSYHVRAMIGEGGMGVVYAGEHTTIGRRVALKVLRPELSLRDDIVERFVQEARAVNTISHGNIVNIYDFGKTPFGSFYIVMEYLDGKTVRSLLDEEGVQPLQRTLTVVSGVGAALAAAHAKGFIHRDVKPENIMLVDRAGVTSIKLLDFGIAKLLSPDGERSLTTHTGAALGTPQYMSPEQLEDVAYDHRADIYSLGAVAYEMLTGQVPYPGKTHAEVRQLQLTRTPSPPSVVRPQAAYSRRLDAAVLWSMSTDPSARCSRMEDFIEHFEAGFNEAAQPTGYPTSTGRKGPSMALIAIVALVAMSVGGALVYLLLPKQDGAASVPRAADAAVRHPLTVEEARPIALKRVKAALSAAGPERKRALEILAEMKRPMTVVRQELRAVLGASGSSPEAKKDAALALSRVPDTDGATADLLGRLLDAPTTTPTMGRVYAKALALLGHERGRAWLRGQLSRSRCADERERFLCQALLVDLGELGDPAAKTGLKQMLEREVLPPLRLRWQEHLAALGDKQEEKKLAETAETNEWPVRVKAATALLRIEGHRDQALQVLRQALTRTQGGDRLAAAFQLGLFRDASSAKVLIEFLESPKGAYRTESVIALGHLAVPTAREALVKALGDASKDLQVAAAVALLPERND